jgi:hypothetical protein
MRGKDKPVAGPAFSGATGIVAPSSSSSSSFYCTLRVLGGRLEGHFQMIFKAERSFSQLVVSPPVKLSAKENKSKKDSFITITSAILLVCCNIRQENCARGTTWTLIVS